MPILLGLCALALAAGCSAPASPADTTGPSAIVGGTHDARWSAAGYLTVNDGDATVPDCGATLIAPHVVVTAAHCVLRQPDAVWWFGTGDVGSRPLVRVVETHVHPSFHATAEGSVDLAHKLRLFDVAYLVLERDVDGVPVARLASEDVAMGDEVQAVAYHADAPGDRATKQSAPATLTLTVDLAGDPILEVHPDGESGLCVADGDEGSPIFQRDDADGAVLVGFFAGSVTQGLTDCATGTQFLDGYESAFGYRDFLGEAIGQ